jgi:hypothetical protein
MLDPLFTIIYYIFQNYILYYTLAALPDKPTNLTVTNITSTSAEISWLDPKNRGAYGLSRCWIKLKEANSLILDITTRRVNKYKISNLTSYTTYKISIAAGNYYGFGEETVTSFSTTSEEGEC